MRYAAGVLHQGGAEKVPRQHLACCGACGAGKWHEEAGGSYLHLPCQGSGCRGHTSPGVELPGGQLADDMLVCCCSTAAGRFGSPLKSAPTERSLRQQALCAQLAGSSRAGQGASDRPEAVQTLRLPTEHARLVPQGQTYYALSPGLCRVCSAPASLSELAAGCYSPSKQHSVTVPPPQAYTALTPHCAASATASAAPAPSSPAAPSAATPSCHCIAKPTTSSTAQLPAIQVTNRCFHGSCAHLLQNLLCVVGSLEEAGLQVTRMPNLLCSSLSAIGCSRLPKVFPQLTGPAEQPKPTTPHKQ